MNRVDALLADIADGDACGPDLSYDNATLELEQCLAGRAERQYGQFLVPAVEPDWGTVLARSEGLLRRSKDLRTGMAWALASTQLQGAGGLLAGLRLIHGLLQRFGARLHPVPDEDEDGARSQQLAVLRGLGSVDTLRHLRRAGVLPPAPLALRQIETTCLPLACLDNESRLTPEELVEGLKQLESRSPGMLRSMSDIHGAALALADLAKTELGALHEDFEPLLQFTAAIHQAARAAADDARILPGWWAGSARIQSVNEALDAIVRVDRWLQRTEPRHPARLLLERVERLLSGRRTAAAPQSRMQMELDD